jgi:hypothetical protein
MPVILEGGDQEDCSLKQALISKPYLEKNLFTIKGWWNGSWCRP